MLNCGTFLLTLAMKSANVKSTIFVRHVHYLLCYFYLLLISCFYQGAFNKLLINLLFSYVKSFNDAVFLMAY